MRTTLDIDETVLAAARALAAARGCSLGAAVSELARRGLDDTGGGGMDRLGVVDVSYSPFPVVIDGQAPVVTDELVARLRDE